MTEGHIYHVTMDFIGEVKNTQEFKAYKEQLAKIKEQPKLYERTNEFRQKNYRIQNTEDGERLMECLEELEKEYVDVRENPLAEDFLSAELCFCRMMQDINELISEEIDFQ